MTYLKAGGTIANKELREITRKLIDQGWRIQDARRGGHSRAFSPDGKTVVILPSTPGGGRWKENLVAELRRGGFNPDA